MSFTFDEKEPIYIQIADQLRDMVFTREILEGDQVPSTTKLSQQLKINPATVLKGMNLLVEDGLIEKKRGMGMFVCKGAYEKILCKRENLFYEDYIEKLVTEALRLNISEEKLLKMVQRGYQNGKFIN